MSNRFFTKINKNGRNVIIDKECHIELIDLTFACDILNRLDLKLKTYNEQLGEQQATINLLLELLHISEEIVISEFSSHIDEDMNQLDKLFKEKDIKKIERYVRGYDDEGEII